MEMNKQKNGTPGDDRPRLVVVSGRTEEEVDTMLRNLESKPVDMEELTRLYKVHSEPIEGHLYRGYSILPSHGIATNPVREIASLSENRRPVWFIFSGMGTQWPGMGRALLKIPVFVEAVKNCDKVLKRHGIDIFHVITDNNEAIFDSILNCFIGVAVMQIGLVEILKSLKIQPDYLMGRSLGEICCAYADGCLTAEQTIESAYYRGLVCVETDLIEGSIAAIGLGHQEVQKLCPPGIEIACHNSSSCTTVSGPAESMKKFVGELQANNIFVKEVPGAKLPYHSSYIAAAGPKLLAYLQKVIPQPKLRSEKWLSTSVEISKWNSESARYCSPEYYTNNFLNTVYFEETSALMAKDAIAIDVAPYGNLQGTFKRSHPTTVTNIPMTQRGNTDSLEVLLQAVGRMFNVGLQPRIDKLYCPNGEIITAMRNNG